MSRVILGLLWLIVLVGCAGLPEPPALFEDGRLSDCVALFDELDRAVAQAEVVDGGYARVEGFPYLRANRFLASFRDERMNPDQAAFWLDRMVALDTQARLLEVANLTSADRHQLELRRLARDDLATDIEACADELAEQTRADSNAMSALRDAVNVPDEYQAWKRVIGLYPLTAQVFLQGVSDYQTNTRTTFDTPLNGLPIQGSLVRYGPPSSSVADWEELRALLDRARNNPLQIPLPDEADLARLLATYAPVIEIDMAHAADQIGMPIWRGEVRPQIDASRPTMFVRVAHTRVEGETLLQLVYSVWFPERPKTGAIDLLGGHLDGITWRVTLDGEGSPLLFDSMHNCGCYHMFFPAGDTRLRAAVSEFEEPPLVPGRVDSLGPGERIVLRVASGTHYLQNVRVEPDGRGEIGRVYAFLQDDELRSLAVGGEGHRRKSLFRPDGIVAGTQRGERFLFWPMGIPDPGAMRQWGRHATAFVGRRHFDDPDLIERYFVIAE